MAELYDVIFYGADSETESFDETKGKVAKLLKVNGEKLEALFEINSGTTLRKGVPLDVAQKYQQALIDAGGTCNYKPSSESGLKLELTPLTDKAVSDRFVCPACGFAKKLRDGVAAPVICPQCDVVADKYQKVLEEKEEREKIRRRLLAKQKSRGDLDDKAQEQQAEQERIKKLEEDIKKELGIPQYLSSKGGRISSASLLLIAGMGLGVVSMATYERFFSPPPKASKKVKLTTKAAMQMFQKMGIGASPEVATMTLNGMNKDELGGVSKVVAMMKAESIQGNMSSVPPSQQAMMVVAGLSQQMANGTISMNGPAEDDDTIFMATSPTMEIFASDSDQTTQSDRIAQGGHSATQSRDDPEWDLTMISLVQRLIDSGKLSQAYQVTHYINNRVWQFNWSGTIAMIFAEKGNVDASGMIWTQLRTKTNKIPRMHERIRNLTKLALYKAKSNDLTGAQMLIQNAESLAKNVTSDEIKALALGYIASAQVRIGLRVTSEANFKLANKLLAKSKKTYARLSAFIELAQAYAESGNKSTALGILNEVRQLSEKIPDPARRGVLAARTAYGLSVIGDNQTAFKTAALIDPVSLRDASLYKIMAEQVNTQSLYSALATSEHIQTADYQAKAHALLARFFVGTTMDSLVDERFLLAEQAGNHITDIVNQAKIMSDIGRYQARIGNNKKSKYIFSTANSLAQQVENPLDRDHVFAHIARNQASTGLISHAVKTTNHISDSALKDITEEAIKQLKKTHRILNSFEALVK